MKLLLKIYIFIILNLLLLTNGYKHVCKRFFRKGKPCLLYVNVCSNEFPWKVMDVLRQKDYKMIQPIYATRFKNPNCFQRINFYIENNFSQETIKTICRKFRVRYAFPTRLIIVQNCQGSLRRNSSRRNSGRRNSYSSGGSRRNSFAE